MGRPAVSVLYLLGRAHCLFMKRKYCGLNSNVLPGTRKGVPRVARTAVATKGARDCGYSDVQGGASMVPQHIPRRKPGDQWEWENELWRFIDMDPGEEQS